MSQTKAQLIDGKAAEIQFNTGSASTPTIAFTGDTNTGIYSPGADQLAISTNGTGRLFVDASGNVQLETGALRLRGSGNSVSADQVSATYLRFAVNSVNALDIQRISTTGAQLRVTQFGSGGTAAGYPVLTNAADTNTGIFFPDSSDTVGVTTGGTERLRITSDGKLGLGTSSPGTRLHVANAGDTPVFIENTSSADTYVYLKNNAGGALVASRTNDLSFHTSAAGTERVRIDSSGRLLVGTSSVVGTGADNSYYALLTVKGAATSPSGQGQMALVRGESSTSITSGETIGRIVFADSDAGNYALIDCTADGTAGSGDYPGRLVFSTTADGASSPTERMRIDSSGRVGIGTTSPSHALDIVGNLAVSQGSRLYLTNNSGFSPNITNTADANSMQFHQANTERMRIDSSGRLLVGTSSTSLSNKFALQGDTSGASNGGYMRLQTANSIVSGTSLGSIGFGDTANNGALIEAKGDVSWSPFTKGSRLEFSTTADGASSPTERMRIDSSGRVGIGTASPGATLDIAPDANRNLQVLGRAATTYGIELKNATAYTTSEFHITAASSGSIIFNRTTNESARIDGSGRLLVGTSSNRGNWFNSSSWGGALVQVESAVDTNSAFSVVNSSNNGNSPLILLGKNRSGSVGGNTVVQSGDACGQLSFFGNDGAEMVEAARITVAVDGTPGADDMPGRLVFSTTADGASSPTERMRISNDGLILIGKTTDDLSVNGWAIRSNGTSQLATNVTGGPVQRLNHNGGGATEYLLECWKSGAQVGSISVTASATAFNTSSDYRLKENVVALTGAADRLNQLQVHRFNFIADPDTTVDGFIAHEAQAVVPECVTGEKDEVDADGNPIYQGIDQSKLVPLLTAALQEALAKIETQAGVITALDARLKVLEGN